MATPKKKLKCPCGRTFKHHLHLGRHAKSCALNPKYNKGYFSGDAMRKRANKVLNDSITWTANDDGGNDTGCIPTPFIVAQPGEIQRPLNCKHGAIIVYEPSRIEKLEKQVADLIAILAKVVK